MRPIDVFTAALRAVRTRYGNIFPAATVETFALKRWQRRLQIQPEAQQDPRFEKDGQTYCEFLLLDEVLLFQQAAQGARKRIRAAGRKISP